MTDIDTREWLLTNGLGSFASGTVSDARTRTYHGWLIAALDPPGRRTLLLSHLDSSLEVAGKVIALETNFWMSGTIEPKGYRLLRSFELDPVPTWIWGEDNWQLTRQMVMPYGLAEDSDKTQNSILIQYRYEGSDGAILKLRPVIGDRDFHHQQQAEPDLQFSQLVGQRQVWLQAIRPSWAGTPWQWRWSNGDYRPDGVWYWDYHLPEETRRGLGDREDLYSPGYLTVKLETGAALTLEAKVGWPDSQHPLNSTTFEQAVQSEQQRSHNFGLGNTDQSSKTIEESSEQSKTPKSLIWRQLLRAGDQFIVYRTSIAGPSIIAGYHWFNDWGRDTLIALPGVALTTGRFALAKGLLETFGRYCRDGLIPNTFPDANAEPIYNSIDATLWWIETLGLYLEATQDWAFLVQQYPVVQQIYKAFTTGTRYNIHIDARDGLLSWEAPGVALTWMDAVVDGQPVTPRLGKPVEINALWYSALCWVGDWAERLAKDAVADPVRLTNQSRRCSQQAEQVKASLQRFWNPNPGYFYDAIEPNDRLNSQIRPNAVLALSLYHCGFPNEQARQVLQLAKTRLLTPYGLRSLDPSDSEYVGNYAGNPQHRDRAYHQGTVWSWLIGPFVRAWQRFYDSEPLPFDWQPLLDHFQHQACLGSISEIFDGDAPNSPQGAIAQAWSVAELIRHYR